MDELPGVCCGDIVKLFVELPIPNRDRARFCCFPATIAWSDEAGTGLVFRDVPLELFAQLEMGIEHLA